MADYVKVNFSNEVPATTPVKYKISQTTDGDVCTDATIELVTSVIPGTALNAANLDHMEDGIYNAQHAADAAQVAADAAQADATQALADAAAAAALAALATSLPVWSQTLQVGSFNGSPGGDYLTKDFTITKRHLAVILGKAVVTLSGATGTIAVLFGGTTANYFVVPANASGISKTVFYVATLNAGTYQARMSFSSTSGSVASSQMDLILLPFPE